MSIVVIPRSHTVVATSTSLGAGLRWPTADDAAVSLADLRGVAAGSRVSKPDGQFAIASNWKEPGHGEP